MSISFTPTSEFSKVLAESINWELVQEIIEVVLKKERNNGETAGALGYLYARAIVENLRGQDLITKAVVLAGCESYISDSLSAFLKEPVKFDA